MPRRSAARCGGRAPTSWSGSDHLSTRSNCHVPRQHGLRRPDGVDRRRRPGRDGPILVPFAAVSADYTHATDMLGIGLCMTTGGLGAGNDRAEAILQGLTELVERDAVTLWRLGGRRRRLETASTSRTSLARLLVNWLCSRTGGSAGRVLGRNLGHRSAGDRLPGRGPRS